MKRFGTDIKHLWKATPIALAILAAGCTGDIDVNAPNDTGAPLSFSVNVPDASRSLKYNGASTSFNKGALIGCVIATKNASGEFEYCANSCWTYNKVDNSNSLYLEKLFDTANNPINIDGASNNILRHYNESDGLIGEYTYAVKLLKENTEYAFHFYYPYVDKDIDATANYTYKYTNETGNEASDVIAPIAAIATPTDGNYKYYDWKNFPVISHINFANSTDNSLLEVNDFMFAKVDKGADNKTEITAANKSGTLKVTFEKKMATIDIIFDTPDAIDEVKLILKPESDSETIARTYLFDMSTGTSVEGSISGLQNFASYPADADGKSVIFPKLIDDSTTKTYRLILPPQSKNITLSVSFNAKAGDATNTYTLECTPAITISGNTRYVVTISKDEKYTWQVSDSNGSLIDKWNVDNIINTSLKESKK